MQRPLLLPLLVLAAPAAAQLTVPAGFAVRAYDAGGKPTGLDLTPPGSAWGERVYFTTFQGELRVVDPLASGSSAVLAGLPAGSAGASSLLYDTGWGSDDLFITMESSTIVRVDSALNPIVWSSGTGILSPNDLCFPPVGGNFGTRLFVSNGDSAWSNIAHVGQVGSATVWSSTPSAASASGLAFPAANSGFPDRLYVADMNNDRVFNYTPDKVVELLPGVVDPIDLAFGPGGAFGTDLYVSTAAGTIERMDIAGTFTTFASGFTFDPNGWNGDLVFQPDGEALWVATDDALVRIGVGPGLPYCHGNGTLAGCPCGNDGTSDARGGCLNSLGLGSKLESFGSASVSADDLGFVATQLPPNQFCILFAGDQSVPEVAIGDGLRCVGGNLVRLDLSPTGANGSGSWPGPLAATGGWIAGDSRGFQVWYRDPVGGPCGTNFNVTNALHVTLLP